MKKECITEIIWIIFLFAITLLIDFLLFGDFSILKDKVDIQLHDTFYVISGIAWVIAVFMDQTEFLGSSSIKHRF